MAELLKPGAAVYAAPVAAGAARKTRYDLTLVEYGGELVSVDSRLPPRLVAETVERGRAAELGSYDKMATGRSDSGIAGSIMVLSNETGTAST